MKNNESLDVLKRIQVCVFIILALLAINTIILLVKGSGSSSDNSTSSSSVNPNYDVSAFQTSTVTDVLKRIKNGEKLVIYQGRETCSACVSYLPTLKQVQQEYGYTTVYLDIEKFSTSSRDFQEYIALLNMTYTLNTSDGEKTDTFGTFYNYTPAVVMIVDGKQADGFIGAYDYETFTSKLEALGFVKQN